MTTPRKAPTKKAPAKQPPSRQPPSRQPPSEQPLSEETAAAATLFWQLAADLQAEDPRVHEGTLMNGRCLRVGKEFLALVDYKGSGLVVKLPRPRVAQLIAEGIGRPFAPAAKVFPEWLSVPTPNRARWTELLREGIAFVGA